MERKDRISTLLSTLDERILLLDGAMGTMIQSYSLTEDDYRGERFADWGQDLKGNNDLLSITRPEVIREIHAAFLDAGADIIETNTFNSNAPSMADYGMESLVTELNTVRRGSLASALMRLPPEPASRATSPARSARPIARRRSRRTSTTRAFATSPSTSWRDTYEVALAPDRGRCRLPADRDHLRHAECQGGHRRREAGVPSNAASSCPS